MGARRIGPDADPGIHPFLPVRRLGAPIGEGAGRSDSGLLVLAHVSALPGLPIEDLLA